MDFTRFHKIHAAKKLSNNNVTEIAHAQTSHHSDYGSNFVTLIMAKTRRNTYDAAFKLKAIDLAVGKGNRAAARELGLNESMIRRWKAA
jgi:hypothetical protein